MVLTAITRRSQGEGRVICNQAGTATLKNRWSQDWFLITSAETRSDHSANRLRVVTKTLRVMQLTAVFLFVCCLSLSARTSSQTISMQGNNLQWQQVFASIEKQTGFVIVTNLERFDKSATVSVNANNVELKTFLEMLFKGKPYDFEIRSKTIFVKEKPASKAGGFNDQLDILTSPPPVKGVVTNADGQPLAGASVKIKGGNTGVNTDEKGMFTISALKGQILIISFVGYKTEEIEVGESDNILIGLVLSSSPLDEVVFKGYYNSVRKTNTGNVAKITSKEIETQPVNNPLQAMQGRMAGVYIQQRTGLPGGSFNIQIRGQNSLRAATNDNGNFPLYIIDGVPFISQEIGVSTSSPTRAGNPLNAINPGDIDKIEVLKDADATAIYGSRGANGVVLITTKRGKAGKVQLDVNFSQGFGKVSRMMDLLDTRQYLLMRNEAFKNDGLTPQPWDSDIAEWDTTRNTDWQKVLIGGTANYTNAQASLSGGNELIQYVFGGAYHRETTVFPGSSSYQKPSAHFNLNHQSSDQRFKASITVNYNSEDNRLLLLDLTNEALRLPPTAPEIYTTSGDLNWANSTFNNPFGQLQAKYKATTDNLISAANFSLRVAKNLTARINAGYNTINLKEVSTTPTTSFPPAWGVTSGNSGFTFNRIKSWIFEPQLDYQFFSGNSVLTATLGGSIQRTSQESQDISATGFSSDKQLENIIAASSVLINSYASSKYKYASLFGRVNYSFKEKYLINIVGRRDGSSRFGPGRQYGNFGAVGAGWIFSNESFFKSHILSFGKLRGSYGTTGNDQILNYQFLDTYTSTGNGYLGVNGLLPQRLFNPDYAWEQNKKMELAIETGFFSNNILLNVSWYRNRSDNQLIGYSLPAVTGFTSITANFPATVQNSGWEFELNSKVIQSGLVKWNISANLSIPKNKLVSFQNIEGSTYANTYSVGQPLSVKKMYKFTGVDPTTGLYTFEDLNLDGSITSGFDRSFIKSASIDLFGGIQNSLTIGSWTLDFLWQYVKQNGYNYRTYFDAPGTWGNQPADVLRRWQKPGDATDIQSFSQDYGSNYTTYDQMRFYGEPIISDASFLRLKNLSLAFAPKKLFKEKILNNIRLYIQGQNLVTVTNYIGMDPEGLNIANLPSLKMYTAGIQFSL